MREIKYLKELPARFLNKDSSTFSLRGADMYVDINGDRFIYIGLVNEKSKPFFSIYLSIKQYDLDGTLLKEMKYMEPATYGAKGLYVTKQAIAVEKECDAIDIYIAYAEFNDQMFFEDSFKAYKSLPLEKIYVNLPESFGDFKTTRTKNIVEDRLNGEVIEQTVPSKAEPEKSNIPEYEEYVHSENPDGEYDENYEEGGYRRPAPKVEKDFTPRHTAQAKSKHATIFFVMFLIAVVSVVVTVAMGNIINGLPILP